VGMIATNRSVDDVLLSLQREDVAQALDCASFCQELMTDPFDPHLEAEAQSNVLVTTDQNLRYQQNLADRRLAILVLPYASWPKLERHKSKIVAALEALQPGDYLDLTLP
jgi:hypothetical protein